MSSADKPTDADKSDLHQALGSVKALREGEAPAPVSKSNPLFALAKEREGIQAEKDAKAKAENLGKSPGTTDAKASPPEKTNGAPAKQLEPTSGPPSSAKPPHQKPPAKKPPAQEPKKSLAERVKSAPALPIRPRENTASSTLETKGASPTVAPLPESDGPLPSAPPQQTQAAPPSPSPPPTAPAPTPAVPEPADSTLWKEEPNQVIPDGESVSIALSEGLDGYLGEKHGDLSRYGRNAPQETAPPVNVANSQPDLPVDSERPQVLPPEPRPPRPEEHAADSENRKNDKEPSSRSLASPMMGQMIGAAAAPARRPLDTGESKAPRQAAPEPQSQTTAPSQPQEEPTSPQGPAPKQEAPAVEILPPGTEAGAGNTAKTPDWLDDKPSSLVAPRSGQSVSAQEYDNIAKGPDRPNPKGRLSGVALGVPEPPSNKEVTETPIVTPEPNPDSRVPKGLASLAMEHRAKAKQKTQRPWDDATIDPADELALIGASNPGSGDQENENWLEKVRERRRAHHNPNAKFPIEKHKDRRKAEAEGNQGPLHANALKSDLSDGMSTNPLVEDAKRDAAESRPVGQGRGKGQKP